jgi:hypothetical protein
MFLVIDDCQSSAIFNSSTKEKNNLSNLCIKNRHIGGDRFGLSIIIAMQNWKSQQGSVSRAIRQNMTVICLWRYRDDKLIDDIYSEVASDVTREQFQKAYDYATSGDRWNYCMIEFQPKFRIRRNFEEIILLDNDSDNTEKISDGKDNDATGTK